MTTAKRQNTTQRPDSAHNPDPEWFTAALNITPEQTTVKVEGANLDVYSWGKKGNPGIIFLHGKAANASWWKFIAPYFSDKFRVTAFSFSGSGFSDWREFYSVELLSQEILQVAESTGLFLPEQKPVIVAHSLSGAFALFTTAKFGDRFQSVYLVDSALKPPTDFIPPSSNQTNKVYLSIEEAISRYKFQPINHNNCDFIERFIARESLRPIIRDGNSGWSWGFDPNFMEKLSYSYDTSPWLSESICPLAFIWGEKSKLFNHEVEDFMHNLTQPSAPKIFIPEAGHHIMIDQPIGLITAIKILLTNHVSTNAA